MKKGCILFVALFLSLQISVQCGSQPADSEDSCRADDCVSAIQTNTGVARYEKVNSALSVDWDIGKLGSLFKGESFHCGALRNVLRKEQVFKAQDAVKGLKSVDFNSLLKSAASSPELVQIGRNSTQDAWLQSMWRKYAQVFSSISHDTMNAFKGIANHGDQANVTSEQYEHATKKALKDSIHDISKELGLNITNDSAAAEAVYTKAQHLFGRLSDDAENSFKNITARHEQGGNHANVTVEEYKKATVKTLKDAIRDISDEFHLNISDDTTKVVDDLSEKFSAEVAKVSPAGGQAQLVQEGVHLMSNSEVSSSCSIFSGSWHQSEHSSKQRQKCDVYSVDSVQDGCSLSIISKDAWWGERASLKADGNKVMIQMPTCEHLFEGTLWGDTISWGDGCEWTRSNGSWPWKTIGFGAGVLAVLGVIWTLR